MRWLLAVLPVVLAAGCGAGPVEVPPPTADTATARLCGDLRFPAKVHGQPRRTTKPRSPLISAWGSPAIAVRCGVGRPAALEPTSQLVTINGIDWLPEPADRPITFTALGRKAYVEVTVPAKYAPPGDVLIELTGVIRTLPKKADGEL